jgi:hypothetical protein
MLALRQLDVALGPTVRAGIETLDHEAGTGRWQELLIGGQAAGEFRPFDTRAMAVLIMGLLGSIPRELHHNPSADAELLAVELAVTIERAIAVQDPS